MPSPSLAEHCAYRAHAQHTRSGRERGSLSNDELVLTGLVPNSPVMVPCAMREDKPMPHMTVEYSANLSDQVDMASFCAILRDAMVKTGIFPLGGIRVRAFPSEVYVIADGDPRHAYIHMICRVGHGREEAVRLQAAETIYSAAEVFLKPRVGDRPFALSFDLDELHPVTSLKRFNTIHTALKAKA